MKDLGGNYLVTDELRDLGFMRVGENVRIHSRSSVYGLENISIEDNCRIDDFSLIVATGRLKIGSNVSIHSHCFIGARFGISIGDFTTLAPGVKIFSSSDDYHGEFLTGPTIPKQFVAGESGEVQISKHVIIGSNSVVLPNSNIREGASIGALSMVRGEISEWSINAGAPTKEIGVRSKQLLRQLDNYLKLE